MTGCRKQKGQWSITRQHNNKVRSALPSGENRAERQWRTHPIFGCNVTCAVQAAPERVRVINVAGPRLSNLCKPPILPSSFSSLNSRGLLRRDSFDSA
jgi:hypothetical protein